MTVDVVRRRADLAALAVRWDELAGNDRRDGFFRTSAWYRAWIEHIRPDAEPFVVVVRDQERIVGLAPLCRLTYRDLGFRLKAIAWAGREVVSGDFLDFIAEEEVRQQVVEAVLKFLWQARSDWGLLVMGELIEDSPSDRALAFFGERYRIPLRRQEQRVCPYISLPRTFDDYLNSLGSSTRYHIRRRMRDVEKKGAKVEIYSKPEQLVAELDTLVNLHLARWRKDNLPGTFGRRGFTDFLRQIFQGLPAGSGSQMYQLRHEGVPVAALLTFTFGESTLYYQAGWDPDSSLAPLSPAVVLMAHSIRDAIQNGYRHYEFLRGDEAYKSRWTKTLRQTTTFIIGRSVPGRAYLRAACIKDVLKRRFMNKQTLAIPESVSGQGSDLHATS